MDKVKLDKLVKTIVLNKNPWMASLTEKDIEKYFTSGSFTYDCIEDEKGNIEIIHIYQVAKDVLHSILTVRTNQAKTLLKRIYAIGCLNNNINRVVWLDRQQNFKCVVITDKLKNRYKAILGQY